MDDRQTHLLERYTAVARRSWQDADYRRRLTDAPRAALVEEGWELPEETAVEVDFRDPDGGDAGDPAERIAEWDAAIAAGHLRLTLPEHPPAGLETRELSDDQLATAAGGLGEHFEMREGFVIPL